MIDDVKDREREFHDARFAAGGSRGGTGIFYRITGASDRDYRSRLFADVAGKNVLEYGCGRGGAAFDLARAGARVTGIDISPVAIEQAQLRAQAEHLDGMTFRVMDAEALEFADGTFDLICGTGILHHLDLARTFGELARTLDSRGRAVFVEPLGHNALINAYRRFTPGARTEDEHPLLVSDLALAGRFFGSVGVTYHHLTDIASVGLVKTPAFNGAAAALRLLDRALFARVPYSRRFAWIAILDLAHPLRFGDGRGAAPR